MIQPNLIKQKACELIEILGIETRPNEKMIIETILKRVYAEAMKIERIPRFKDVGCEMKINIY